MSEKMELSIDETEGYTKEQIVNEFVRKFPRSKLVNIIKFVKTYNKNESKYLNNNINEIVMDCIRSE